MKGRGFSQVAAGAILLAVCASPSAQRPESAPDTASAGKPPEFKVNAAINQHKLLKNPPQRGGRGRSGANP